VVVLRKSHPDKASTKEISVQLHFVQWPAVGLVSQDDPVTIRPGQNDDDICPAFDRTRDTGVVFQQDRIVKRVEQGNAVVT
jgi:hypothetical protein